MSRRLFRNAGILLRDLLMAPIAMKVPRDWLIIRLDRGVVEAHYGSLFTGLNFQRVQTLASILEALEYAKTDAKLKGVLFRVGTRSLGWGKAYALARSLQALKDAGKKVVTYSESSGNAGAWLGALSDHFWMTPEGRLDLLGVHLETPYIRGALDRLQIRPKVVSAGRYKGTGEMLERSSMSEAAREALDQVADGLYAELVAALVPRAGSEGKARGWIDGGPYLASEAKEHGLVDELVYVDELPKRMAMLMDADAENDAPTIAPNIYRKLARPRFRTQPLNAGPSDIAVVPLLGAIRPGSASPRGVIGVLRALAENSSVAAVVIRIDSPGGDALASDLIWRAVVKLAEKKPVVASMGDTAASGGYYVAMAAREIVAEPTTITGSIGVVLASFEVEGLLRNWGVAFDGVARGRHAGIYSISRARTPEEEAIFRRQVDRLYQNFVSKAATGRGMTDAKLGEVAQGRIWTGADAKACGLVDHLGGLGHAIDRARGLAGVPEGQGSTVHLSGIVPPIAMLMRSNGAAFWCPIEIPLN